MHSSGELKEKQIREVVRICEISAGGLIMLENLIAIIILYRSSRLIFQVKFLAMNLSIADFLVGVTLVLPDDCFTYWNCKLKKYFVSIVVNVSVLSITTINADRVLIFRFAMRYYKHITERTVIVLCVISWPIAVLLSYLTFFDYSNGTGLNCADVFVESDNTVVKVTARSVQFLVMLSNILMLAYMMYYVRTKLRRIETSVHVPSPLGNADEQLIRKLLCLTGSFIVMTFPFFIVFNLSSLAGLHGPQPLTLVFSFICLMNSALNPVVYVWRFREPRYQLQLLLCFFNESLKERIRQRRNQSLAEFSMQANRSIFEQGQERGHEQGQEQGQEQNQEREQERGNDQGQEQGQERGHEQGQEQSHKQGQEQGQERGNDQGQEQGQQQSHEQD
jgi:hypothetical protein